MQDFELMLLASSVLAVLSFVVSFMLECEERRAELRSISLNTTLLSVVLYGIIYYIR